MRVWLQQQSYCYSCSLKLLYSIIQYFWCRTFHICTLNAAVKSFTDLASNVASCSVHTVAVIKEVSGNNRWEFPIASTIPFWYVLVRVQEDIVIRFLCPTSIIELILHQHLVLTWQVQLVLSIIMNKYARLHLFRILFMKIASSCIFLLFAP